MSVSIAVPHQPTRPASQGTIIESNRVAAEVYAAILVAQQCPRDEQQIRREAKDLCGMEVIAQRAFFKFPTGGKTVEGPTIKLALELVRIWRNTQWGISELARHPTSSEILAYAWDCETNARSSRIVIVEHKRDKKKGETPEDLTDMREILNNNTSIGSRQLRETIWTILPLWYTELAVGLCRSTLEHGGGIPLVERRENVLAHFRLLGVREEQLVAKVGRPTDRWDAQDLASLQVTYGSLKRHEVTVEDEFPTQVVTIQQIHHATTQAAPSEKTGEPERPAATDEGASDGELPTDRGQLVSRMHDLFADGGLGTTPTDRKNRLRVITRILELPTALANVNALTAEQVRAVVEFLARCQQNNTLEMTLRDLAEGT